jgi:phenylalanyl-tRNA synthetase beta chain
MKLSENWLREWVSPSLSTRELAEQLTMSGLEVESIARAGAKLAGVVVAEVFDVAAHPDAERLSVCRVGDGSSVHQVVCGARNVRPGLRVAFARENAELPGMQIRRSTIRGVESSGMLCSAAELGIESRKEGLLELPASFELGTDITAALRLDDSIIELGLTPNRGDCLSILGLAREVALLNGLELSRTTPKIVEPMIKDVVGITLDAPHACPRYAGRVIRNIDPSASTPLWMEERLRRSGVRSIDPVVDVTNYVMLELGQPMHAFDRATIHGRVIVRMAHAGERLTLLDGSELELRSDTLLIADEKGPLAAAGIMGGRHSAVASTTRDIFLESAFFAPGPMAGKARGYGMHTDASQRFERGVDFELQSAAIERATELLLAIVGGEPGPTVTVSSADHLPALPQIVLRRSRLDALLGLEVPADDVVRILRQIGCTLGADDAGWNVRPPSFRFDLRIEADLIEEIARVYGYDRIPARVQPAALVIQPNNEGRRSIPDLRRHLVAIGYQEAISYSFVDPQLQSLLDPLRQPVAVTNPISADMAVMRTTLWAGLIKALQFNQHRQQKRVRLFETGLRFIRENGVLHQKLALAGIVSGERAIESWAESSRELDFFDIKGDIESLLGIDETSANLRFEPATHPALHAGQCARVRRGNEELGILGALNPELYTALDVRGPVYLFELDFESLSKKNLPKFKGLSKFPEVRRDIAVVVDEMVSSAAVLDTVRATAGDCLVDLRLIDIYRGQGIEKAKKSMAIGFVLQHADRTLTDAEVNAIQDRVLAALADACGAVLRY